MRPILRPATIVFLITLAVYSLLAWDRLEEPSPQFHFVDLAHSFLDGRLDTDTPKQRRHTKPRPDDPPGYRKAIRRTLASGGWNDWAEIRTLTLKDGTQVRGRFPWAGDRGDRRHTFWTNDNRQLQIIVPQELARTCGKHGRSLCNESHHYVSFPPMPALVMLPAVAIWGYDTNDVLITILIAAFNALLLFLLLELLTRRGHSARSRKDNLWLTALFAFGTVIFFSSVRGEVWFSALVFGLSFNLLYIMAALDARHPVLAGLMLAFGMATRTPIAFCVVFFAWQLFFPNNRFDLSAWKHMVKRGLLFAAPVLAGGIALMMYNEARFDSAFEFGHSYLKGGAAGRIRDHGLFSFNFLNTNLSAAFVNLPRLSTEAPYFQVTKHGLSLLFTTPVLFLLARPATKHPLMLVCWLTVAAAAIPGLLYQNTGWEQFGYRFAIDYLPYLFILLALGGRPLTKKVKAVIIFAIIVNLFGAITFGRMPMFYY